MKLRFIFGRIIRTVVSGVNRARLGSMNFMESDDDDPVNGTESEPLFGLPGFFFVPKPPVSAGDATGLAPEGHTEVLGVDMDDHIVPLGYRDLRIDSQINPTDGDIGLAQYGGGFVSLQDNTDVNGSTFVVYMPRKDSSGTVVKAHALSIDSTESESHIVLLHEKGHSIRMDKDGNTVIANASGTQSVVVKDSGDIVINAENVVINGAVNMGSENPAATDFVALSSLVIAQLTALKVAIAGAAVLANDGGAVFKSNIASALSAWPETVAATKVKAL